MAHLSSTRQFSLLFFCAIAALLCILSQAKVDDAQLVLEADTNNTSTQTSSIESLDKNNTTTVADEETASTTTTELPHQQQQQQQQRFSLASMLKKAIHFLKIRQQQQQQKKKYNALATTTPLPAETFDETTTTTTEAPEQEKEEEPNPSENEVKNNVDENGQNDNDDEQQEELPAELTENNAADAFQFIQAQCKLLRDKIDRTIIKEMLRKAISLLKAYQSPTGAATSTSVGREKRVLDADSDGNGLTSEQRKMLQQKLGRTARQLWNNRGADSIVGSGGGGKLMASGSDWYGDDYGGYGHGGGGGGFGDGGIFKALSLIRLLKDVRFADQPFGGVGFGPFLGGGGGGVISVADIFTVLALLGLILFLLFLLSPLFNNTG